MVEEILNILSLVFFIGIESFVINFPCIHRYIRPTLPLLPNIVGLTLILICFTCTWECFSYLRVVKTLI